MAAEFRQQLEMTRAILVPRHGSQKITRIRQPVRADRAEVRKTQWRAEILAHITSCPAVQQLHTEAQAARHDGDLLRLDLEHAELRGEAQAPELRHDQQLPVGVIDKALLHRAVGDVPVNSTPPVLIRRSVSPRGDQARHEVRRCRGNRQRVPAQGVGRSGLETMTEPRSRGGRLEFAVRDSRPDPVQPAVAVGLSRRRERRARELLGVQAIRAALWRIASLGERTG